MELPPPETVPLPDQSIFSTLATTRQIDESFAWAASDERLNRKADIVERYYDGSDPLKKKMLVLKSANHFFGAFSKIASRIIYIDAGGPYPGNPFKVDYKKLKRPIWPLDPDPHG